MKRTISILSLIAILFSAFAVPAFAQDAGPIEPLTPPPSAETGEMVDETPALWFVELTSPPAVDGTRFTTLKNEKAAFRVEAKKAGLTYTERYAFDTLWNGLSVRIEPGQLAALARLPGVKAIYPVETIALPETFSSDPELYTSLAMVGADIAQSELGFTGAGIKVAVMDTGIDVDHPAFGGDGVARYDSPLFPSARVAYGYDLVGDAFNAAGSGAALIPVPDDNPDDCAGHGTHVAGIIGANDATNGLKGVAPDVTFGAYRVFGCEGSTFADIMIAAMEMALADGMQVLNMSIGSAFQWPQYPTAVASDNLVNKGMVVVASIGNSGANGLYSAGAPGLGKKVIGVASYDNTYVALNTFTVTPAGLTIGYANAAAAPLAPLYGSLPLAKTGTPASTADACTVTGPLPDLTGHAVLIRRGTCGFYEKARRAELAGASAVVLYNNSAGRFSPTVAVSIGAADGQPVTIPVVAISDTEGVAINNAIEAGTQTLNWTDQMGSFPSPTGGLISSSSSYGLSPDLALKPDIGAPGGNIYSSYPLEKGGYATLGGTSMASPHVAGAAALLLQAKPNTPSQIVRTILQNSADPKVWWGNPGLGFLDNVHRQGAGMLDIDDAILATTKIEPAKLSVGEGEAGAQTFTLSLENNAGLPVTYDLSYINALSTGGVITPGFFTSNASVTFGAPNVTIPAGGTASVQATIYPATGPTYGQYGGYIVFTPQDGGQVYRVPFAGFVGDYQGIQVLTPTPNGFPWLAISYLGSYYGPVTDPSEWTYTMVGEDVPNFLVHFEHQARLFRVEIFDANGKAWHRAYNEEYLGRNSTSTSFFAYPFDGYTVAGKKTYTVPDGTYYAKISVLKALGDDDNPDHWETWTSPMFVIDRP
jgi:minor extracellular serine protease Vpr